MREEGLIDPKPADEAKESISNQVDSGLKRMFYIEAQKRRTPKGEALEQAMRLWLGSDAPEATPSPIASPPPSKQEEKMLRGILNWYRKYASDPAHQTLRMVLESFKRDA